MCALWFDARGSGKRLYVSPAYVRDTATPHKKSPDKYFERQDWAIFGGDTGIPTFAYFCWQHISSVSSVTYGAFVHVVQFLGSQRWEMQRLKNAMIALTFGGTIGTRMALTSSRMSQDVATLLHCQVASVFKFEAVRFLMLMFGGLLCYVAVCRQGRQGEIMWMVIPNADVDRLCVYHVYTMCIAKPGNVFTFEDCWAQPRVLHGRVGQVDWAFCGSSNCWCSPGSHNFAGCLRSRYMIS